jgi:hypothetical protein
VPLDPFDVQPFRYRLSAGEQLESADERRLPPRFVPAGQGILWRVGGDQRDDGGQRFGADEIFVVPAQPRK